MCTRCGGPRSFLGYLREWNAELVKEGCNIALVLDNATCHPKSVDLSNIELIFLPANTTSHVQPLDQGITIPISLHHELAVPCHQRREGEIADFDLNASSITILCTGVEYGDAQDYI